MERPPGSGVINLSLGSTYVSAFNTAVANAAAAGLVTPLQATRRRQSPPHHRLVWTIATRHPGSCPFGW